MVNGPDIDCVEYSMVGTSLASICQFTTTKNASVRLHCTSSTSAGPDRSMAGVAVRSSSLGCGNECSCGTTERGAHRMIFNACSMLVLRSRLADDAWRIFGHSAAPSREFIPDRVSACCPGF
jgi:hypothetical protein